MFEAVTAFGEMVLMQDWMNLLMLVCASLAALAFGVLSAQAICRVAFTLLGVHARSVTGQSVVESKVTAATA